MPITLYDLAGAEEDRRFSPNCWRTRLALAHKDLPTETVPWRFSDKAAIAPSGQGRVPVIVDAGKWVADSWTIANYLEDTYSDRPALFGGGAGRALARFFTNWADTVLHPGVARLVILDIWNHVHEKDKAYFRRSREDRFGATLERVQGDRDQRVVRFRESLQPVRATLQAQAFLGGDTPLYPDYIVFGAFQWARCISPFKLLERDDPIAPWRDRMLELFGGLARKGKGYPV